MAICASPDYLRKHGTPRTPAELADHECLDFMVGMVGIHWRMQNHARPARQAAPECRFRANNGLALRMAALQGFGIVMQAEILVAQDIAAGRLVPLLCDYLPAPRHAAGLSARPPGHAQADDLCGFCGGTLRTSGTFAAGLFRVKGYCALMAPFCATCASCAEGCQPAPSERATARQPAGAGC
jgi:DNA-binding transcriptional LysR family regulator